MYTYYMLKFTAWPTHWFEIVKNSYQPASFEAMHIGGRLRNCQTVESSLIEIIFPQSTSTQLQLQFQF